MSKFKVGDRVRRTKDFPGGYFGLPYIPRGTIGTVIGDESCTCPRVKFDGYPPVKSDNKYMELVDFTKSDLKPGYVVEFRSGRKALILPYHDVRGDCDALLMVYDAPNSWSWDPVDACLSDDLLWKTDNGDKSQDVIRVYGLSVVGGRAISAESVDDRRILWERKEPKKMTVAEVCKALGYDVEIVKDGATDA